VETIAELLVENVEVENGVVVWIGVEAVTIPRLDVGLDAEDVFVELAFTVSSGFVGPNEALVVAAADTCPTVVWSSLERVELTTVPVSLEIFDTFSCR